MSAYTDDQARFRVLLTKLETKIQQVANGSVALLFEVEEEVEWGTPEAMATRLGSAGYDRQAKLAKDLAGPGWVIIVTIFEDGGAMVTRGSFVSPVGSA